MKRFLLFISIVLVAFAAMSQEVGSSRISNLKVERSESNLLISMDIVSPDMKANTELHLTPVIKAEGHELSLQEVVLAGRTRYYQQLRHNEGSAARLYRAGRPATVLYEQIVPYEEWMESAEFELRELSSGCCDEPLAQNVTPLTRFDYRPRRQVLEPQFAFVVPVAEAVKTREVTGQAYIDFPVNRTEIYPDYRKNPTELQKIRQTIDVVRNDADTRITALSIKGYASPEGSYSNNERLAKGRTESLKNYVQSLYSFPAELLHTSYEPEDWEGLIRWLNNNEIANRDAILAIATNNSLEPDKRDRKIKTDFPKQYAFLLAEVYPALRHSDYKVEYQVRDFVTIEEIAAVMRTAPQKLSLNELFRLAQSYDPSSDEYAEVFEVAVRMYPDDPIANLNAANTALGRGNLTAAARYLEKAGDTPQATYARGILAARNSDNEQALRLFKRAADAGLAEAADALQQLNEIINQ